MTNIDILSIDQDAAWRLWAVAYFFAIGAAAGAALLVAYSRLILKREARAALMAASIFALAAPLPLLADLHQPARFFQFYLSFAPDSVMWWGSWLLPLFIGTTILMAWLTASRRGNAVGTLERTLTLLNAFLALGILGYTSGEMAAVSARPLWASAGFPILLTLSAILSGAGATMLVAALSRHHQTEDLSIVRKLVLNGAALTLLASGIWLMLDSTLADFALQTAPLLFFGGFLVCGLVLPALLSLLPAQKSFVPVVTGLLTLLGALLFRWQMFVGAQAISKTESANYFSIFETSHEVWQVLAGSLGILVLSAIAISLLFSFYLPKGGQS